LQRWDVAVVLIPIAIGTGVLAGAGCGARDRRRRDRPAGRVKARGSPPRDFALFVKVDRNRRRVARSPCVFAVD
ncbi:hypothetical protein LGM80_22140, partial [Burkholderia multivorans]|nr:hypothetical protein [Burkholderia multivorans]